ncbi:MAG: M28 family peptidase [Bacteroidia bacterium]|nr:M28 family peptidase [Bacteroidia bacterium]MDW8014658.1 M28 family peptidase [Bacteroidia bacterium]
MNLFLWIPLWGQALLLEKLHTNELDTIIFKAIQSAVSVRELRAHVEFLASDALQGREAGTPYEKVAAAYLIAQHRRFGSQPLLKEGYIHAFPLSSRKSLPPKRSRKPTSPRSDTSFAWNVIGIQRGSVYPHQYIILCAHYDHIGTTPQGEVYNGADDNGSGTALLLEVARVLQSLPPPKRTILFFHTAAEEKGLLGAFRFVRDSLIPLDSIVAVINADMLGRTDTLHAPEEFYLYAIGSDRTTPRLRHLHEKVNNLCCGWHFDYRYDTPKDPLRLFYRSDHYAFAQKGVPIVFYFGGFHSDYHKVEDDADKIDFERLKKATILIASLAWTLATLE